MYKKGRENETEREGSAAQTGVSETGKAAPIFVQTS